VADAANGEEHVEGVIVGPEPGPEAEPAQPPVLGALRGPRAARPDASLDLPGGVISYYVSKHAFAATCGNPMHGACVLTRSSTKRAHMKGRPLSLMAAWLQQGPLHDTKESHWRTIAELACDAEALRSARQELLLLPAAGGVLARERGLDPGEADP